MRGQPASRFSEDGIGAYAMVSGAYLVVYATSYIYAVVIARLLGPTDYAALASLLAVGTIAATGIGGPLQSIIAKYVSADRASGAEKNARYLVKRALLIAVVFSGAALLAGAALARPVKQWLDIAGFPPLLLLSLYIAIWLIHPVTSGAVQGLQRFKVLSAGFVVGAVARVASGIALVAAGLGVTGAMAGEAFGAVVVVLVLGGWTLRWLGKGPAEGSIDVTHLKKFAPAVIVSSACLMSFVYMDVFLVRGLIGGSQSGYYAAAQKLSSVMYFIPGVLAVVLFPRASAKFAAGTEPWRLFWKVQASVAAICGSVAIVFAVFPGWSMRMVFGSRYVSGAPLLPVLSLAMFCFSMLPVCSQFLLATDRYGFVYLLVAGAIVEVIAVFLFHASARRVAWVVAAVSVATLASMGAYVSSYWLSWQSARKSESAGEEATA